MSNSKRDLLSKVRDERRRQLPTRKKKRNNLIIVNEVTQDQQIEMSKSQISAIQNKSIEQAERFYNEKKREVFKKRKKVEHEIMPLEHEMQRTYQEVEVQGAEHDDKVNFRDGVFHADEQEEKTILMEEQQGNKLYGLDEPDDPGYYPPILLDTPSIKYPVYQMQSEYSGKDFYVFPLTWSQIGLDWTIIVLGKRRSGKSRFIKSLCGNYLKQFFPRVVVFTKTKCSGEYSHFIPDAHIHEGIDEEILAKYFDLQKKYKKKKIEGKFTGNMKLLIIIDDCLSEQLKYRKTVDEVFFEGRHLDICFIVTSQDFKGINPSCTSNADLAVSFNCRSERDKEAVRTKFCDFFKNDEEMESLTNLVTHRKWHVICFDQSEPSRDPSFTIFCGRAPDPPPFLMGCAAWWKHNPKQLVAIINKNPDKLAWMLNTPHWGIEGEGELNSVL